VWSSARRPIYSAERALLGRRSRDCDPSWYGFLGRWCICAEATHSVALATPSQFDFAIATITLAGPVTGLELSVTGSASERAVGAAVARAKPRRPPGASKGILIPPVDPHPGRMFVVITNRQLRGSSTPAANSITLRIHTSSPGDAPMVIENLNVLADGAPGADCSMLHYFPGISGIAPGAWSFANADVVLRSLLAWRSGGVYPSSGTNEVASALDVACHGFGGEELERWVRQEAPPVHP
jgi:hypothetical protein